MAHISIGTGAVRPTPGGRRHRRARTVLGALTVVGLVAFVGCTGDSGGTAEEGSSTTVAPSGPAANELIGPDGRFAFPAPRLAQQVSLTPDDSGGASASFSVAYAVANPEASDGAAPDEATVSLQIARAMTTTGPRPSDLVFTTSLTDTDLHGDDVTRDYSIELPADAYQFLLTQGIGSGDAGARAAALRLLSVSVQQHRDFRVVDGTLDWIHGSTFDAATSPTAPADNPGGAVTVSNDTATGIYSYPWSGLEPVGQLYGPNLAPVADRFQTVSTTSQGVSIALAGQAVSCLYQGTDGSNPQGFTTNLGPGTVVTQTIVANDSSTSQPADASDTAEVSQAVVQSIGAGLHAIAAITEAGFSAPFTLIVKMADVVFDLSTNCNNQPNLFQLGAVTQDGQGTNNTTWAIWDGCSGTCGGLANVYSSPWESSAPNIDASMDTDAVQLAPSDVTYQGQPLWLAQVPTGGCGVGDGSDSNTSGCTSQNWISLRWATEPPCPWTNGLEDGNGDVQGDVSWCYQPAPSSPAIPACGASNADCLAYDPHVVTLRGVVLAAAVAAIAAAVGCSPRGSPDLASVPIGGGPALVAVVDTGIDPHVTLGGMLDTSRSRSAVPGESVDDRDGHGTEVAAVVHANAPGALIAAVKASGADGTSDERLAVAVDHAAGAGASVILLSLAGAEPLPLTRAAIERAGGSGALVVVAAGNDGVDIGDHPSYPASYALANLVPVAALDRDGHLLGSSNRGRAVEAAARGVAVPTCTLRGEAATTGGTSAAAALVAARAAHLLEQRTWTVAELRTELEQVSVGAAHDGAPPGCHSSTAEVRSLQAPSSP